MKENGISIMSTSFPVELNFLINDITPFMVVGFYSMAMNTLYRLYPQAYFFNIKLAFCDKKMKRQYTTNRGKYGIKWYKISLFTMNILYSQSHLSLNYKVVFSILFILNPTVASLLILFFLSGKSCKVNHVFLGMILSAYVSLINVTKVPVNDLESYLEYFSAAGDMPLYEYLFYWNKYKAGVESLKRTGLCRFLIFFLSYFRREPKSIRFSLLFSHI